MPQAVSKTITTQRARNSGPDARTLIAAHRKARACLTAAEAARDAVRYPDSTGITIPEIGPRCTVNDQQELAFALVSRTLEDAAAKVEELQAAIFHKTWAYVFAPNKIVRPEPEPEKDFSDPAASATIRAIGAYLADGIPIPKTVVTDLAALQVRTSKQKRQKTKNAS